MPIALSRAETASLSLKSDEEVPEAERPVFLFFHLTREEQRQVDAWRDEAQTAPTVDAVEVIADRIVNLGLAGWRNMRDRDGKEIPFAPGTLDRVATRSEKIELAGRYPEAVGAAEVAKKKRRSESPPSPATDASAPAAATDSASTPQPTATP